MDNWRWCRFCIGVMISSAGGRWWLWCADEGEKHIRSLIGKVQFDSPLAIVNHFCCLYLCGCCFWWWWRWRPWWWWWWGLRMTLMMMMKEEVKEENSTEQQEQRKGRFNYGSKTKQANKKNNVKNWNHNFNNNNCLTLHFIFWSFPFLANRYTITHSSNDKNTKVNETNRYQSSAFG